MPHEYRDALDLETDNRAFPSLWVTRVFAYAVSVATMPLLWLLWGGERDRGSDDWADPYFLSGWLLLAVLVPGWLAYIWTGQEHLDHATAAFMLAIGLVVASVVVAFA